MVVVFHGGIKVMLPDSQGEDDRKRSRQPAKWWWIEVAILPGQRGSGHGQSCPVEGQVCGTEIWDWLR
jgi:hypothetical protein